MRPLSPCARFIAVRGYPRNGAQNPVPWNIAFHQRKEATMASDDETIDRLTDEELDELTSPDDNPD